MHKDIQNSEENAHFCFIFSFKIIVELTELCQSNSCSHEQRLLKNMGALQVILELLQVPYKVQCIHLYIHIYILYIYIVHYALP